MCANSRKMTSILKSGAGITTGKLDRVECAGRPLIPSPLACGTPGTATLDASRRADAGLRKDLRIAQVQVRVNEHGAGTGAEF
jgi:hypothetical protein